MMRGAVVVRPEPGNGRTAARLAASGIAVQRCPLFHVEAVAWQTPDPARFDALLLTSANAVRHAGAGLDAFAGLPALAVGTATAIAARDAALSVALVGDRDAAGLVAQAHARGWTRLLHLAGRDRVALAGVEQVTVYASGMLPIPPGLTARWRDHVLLLHSARAARRCAALVERDGVDRECVAVAAISPAVAQAAGEGWAGVTVADLPADAALVRSVGALIDRPEPAADKRGA